MLSILSLSFFVHSLTFKFSCLVSSSFFLIVSKILLSFAYPLFQCLQFLSSLLQYSSLYFLSDYPNNIFAMNLPGNSSLLKLFFSLFCQFTSSMSCQYFFLNSSIVSFVFSRFFLSSQVSDSAINPFYFTRHLFFSLICCLFKILSTSYFSFSSIMTRASCSFLCPLTCPTYFCILLMLTTGCIFTILSIMLPVNLL